MKNKHTVSYPLRMAAELDEKINEATRLSGLPKQEVIRMAIAVGLDLFRRCNYSVTEAIVIASNSPGPSALPVAAEDPPEIRPEGCIPPTMTTKPVNYRRIAK